MKCPGYGSGSEAEAIHVLLELFDAFLVPYAKPVFLIDDEESEGLEPAICLKQPVGPDYDVHSTAPHPVQYGLLRPLCLQPAYTFYCDGKPAETFTECAFVLFCQKGGGYQYAHLSAILHCLECSAHGDLGLAKPHIST